MLARLSHALSRARVVYLAANGRSQSGVPSPPCPPGTSSSSTKALAPRKTGAGVSTVLRTGSSPSQARAMPTKPSASKPSIAFPKTRIGLTSGATALRRNLAVVPESVVPSGSPWRLELPSHQLQGGIRMKLHANARTCPHSRRLAVSRVEQLGWTLTAAAEAAGVSVRTISKWRRRYRVEGEQGLLDRCSAPLRVPLRTSGQRSR